VAESVRVHYALLSGRWLPITDFSINAAGRVHAGFAAAFATYPPSPLPCIRHPARVSVTWKLAVRSRFPKSSDSWRERRALYLGGSGAGMPTSTTRVPPEPFRYNPLN